MPYILLILAWAIPHALGQTKDPQTSAAKKTAATQVHITIDDLPWMVEAGREIPATVEETKEQNQRLLNTFSKHDIEVSVFFTCERIRPGDGRAEGGKGP